MRLARGPLRPVRVRSALVRKWKEGILRFSTDGKLAFPVLVLCLFIGPAASLAGNSGARMDRPLGPNLLDGFPADWVGVWQYETDIKDCDSGVTLFHMSRLDTVCAGDTFDPQQDGTIANLVCNGTVTSTEVHYTCTGSAEEEPGCFADYEFVYDATRTGNSVQATQTLNTTYTGDCPLSSQCLLMEMTGTRLVDAAPNCQLTASRQNSWGALKEAYR